MGVLQFNNTSDKLTFASISGPLSTLTAHTCAYLFKRPHTGQFDALGYTLTAGGVAEVGLSISNDDGLLTDTGGGARGGGGVIAPANNVWIAVATKTAGTVAPRFHYLRGDIGTWTHVAASSGTENDALTTASLEIGVWETSNDFFGGHMGLVGFWSGAMSDSDVDALSANWRTSDWWNSAHGQPVFLAELNVAGASVVDLAGNASSLSASGTTLDASETLLNWNFNGTGAAAPAAPYRESRIRRSRATTW